MSTLYLLKYNNYFNRTIKYYNTLNDYLSNVTYYRKIDDINFNYNDNVNTMQTINWGGSPINEQECDYLLVDNGDYGLSRWFIIENKWNRKGQQLLTLRRDLVVDFMGSYLTQPLFAEKGCISVYDATTIPILSNSENILSSQILKSHTNLAASNRAIVGYIDRTYSGNKIASDVNTIYINSFSELGIYNLIGNTVWHTLSGIESFYINIKSSTQSGYKPGAQYRCDFGSGGTTLTSTNWYVNHTYDSMVSPFGADDSFTTINSHLVTAVNNIASLIHKDIEKESPDSEYNAVLVYNNQPIMMQDKLYRIKLVPVGSTSNRGVPVTKGTYEAVSSALQQNGITMIDYAGYDSAGPNEMWLATYGQYYQVTLVEDTETASFTLQSVNQRAHCGQPYDIFYMADSATARQIAGIIGARLYSSGAVYDIQLLPYAPSTSNSTSQTITYKGTSVTLYWISTVDATYSSSSFTKTYNTALDAKLGCLCDTVRICSPNHANSWDFNPAQNGGVASFSIRCTFKPFDPYIHIKPNFGYMYGHTWAQDPRGLICEGSFSLPVVSDKWAQYQINNSSYYNAFNREIENLSTVQDAQRINEEWQMGVGVLQGAVTGAGLGSYLSGGNYAALAGGAVAGGAASLVAGIADYQMNEKLRNEAIDYRNDQFGFNSQNMIASPRTLSRTDSVNIDWNGTAYIEFYSASDTEIANIKSKLKYNGFTMNYLVRTNTEGILQSGIKDLLNTAKTAHSNYVKGKLIYTTQYADTHIFNEIANEWFKGFYWEGDILT